MSEDQLHVVTGAFGYTGRYIAERLLAKGHRVRTLTNSPTRRNPFGGALEALPFNFDAPEELVASLQGAAVLYNTYWVRFDHHSFSHAGAIDNTLRLFEAAAKAGVERVVHVSITNPSANSPLPYFSGKARLEEALQGSGMSYAILRPAVIFGYEDILVNNIAWALRRLPVFGLFGDGAYRLQPIFVGDFADLAVEQGESRDNAVIDAIGPETFTYRELVEQLGDIIGRRRPLLATPPFLAYLASRLIGFFMRDLFVTREEITGLMADLLYTDSPPAGATKLTDWARDNAAALGRSYASELGRRRDRLSEYRTPEERDLEA